MKLFLVGIGTVERSRDFADVTGFPKELLMADPDNVLYSALRLKKGVLATFFSQATAFSFLKRIRRGSLGDLGTVLKTWVPWNPPKLDQALQQGGMFVFDGEECIFTHYDRATGDHADYDEVLRIVTAPRSKR